ncbi:MAG: gamma-glutamyl kinase [Pseudomonadota bacterium]
MLVFWQEKLVLLALPKTGTSALEAALRGRAAAVFESPPELKHVPLFRYNRFLKPLFGVIDGDRKLETMALVREPVDWLGSWYRYRSRPELVGHPNGTSEMSFDDFVAGYLEDPRPGFANVGSPTKFLSNGQGKRAVTHLFQYEQLHMAVDFLSERLGVEITLARHNVSPARDMPLSPDLRRRLEVDCAGEFDLWESAHRAG